MCMILQLSTKVPILCRPNALFSRRQDSLRVERILQPLDKSPVSVIVEVIGIGNEVHVVNMRPILAEATFPSFLVQIAEDDIDRPPVFWVGLVENHHVDEDDMSLMHEKVAEQIKPLRFANTLCCLHPFQDSLA